METIKKISVKAGNTHVKYKLTRSACAAEECEHCMVYGVEVTIGENKIERARIDDLTSLRHKAEEFLSMLERNIVMPSELLYIAEDYVNQ